MTKIKGIRIENFASLAGSSDSCRENSDSDGTVPVSLYVWPFELCADYRLIQVSHIFVFGSPVLYSGDGYSDISLVDFGSYTEIAFGGL